MPRTAEDILEFDKLRDILRRRTTCAPGRRAVDVLAPSRDRARLEAAFALIREAMAYLRAGSDLGFGALADPETWLARIEGPGAVLAPGELLDAASLAETTGWLKQQFREDAAKFPLLAARAASLADFRDVLGAIRRAILPNGEISDDASAQLKRIRAAIAKTRESIQKTLKQILRVRGAEAGEDYVTLRNDRFVIPVRATERREVQGVVHGSSGTGQTVFVEPFPTVEMNNQLVQYAEDEAAEIARILRELTERLQTQMGPLQAAAATIAELDTTFARARFAREFNCAIPEFSPASEVAGELRLEGARHPVLEERLRMEGRAVVPMTLALGGEETVLVISGPNTGGKTVALKTTGLAALAAQSGIPVAADRAVLPLVDHVLADIGDEQSIGADLSTFSAHVMNLKAMLEAATPQSLVLVDEMGTGTAPEEGSALAVALLEEFRAKRCLVLATTHHDRLKAYASATPGIVNAAVEFDEVQLRPTYRLMVGVPGGSSGIAIAKRLGLAPRIIEHAMRQLAPETREAAELIAYLHRSRDELDQMKRQMNEQMRSLDEEKKKLQTEWLARQQKRLAELEQKFGEMQKRFEQEIARAVEAVKERELRTQIEKQARRKMVSARSEAREEVNAAVVQHLSESQEDLGTSGAVAQPVTPELLIPGARIHVRGFNKAVTLRRRDGNSAEIEAGPLRMKIQIEDITEIESQPLKIKTPEARRSSVTVKTTPSEEEGTDEINVIGCTVEEATRRVDKFLDDAALANKPRIRVIHGHGTGALRRGLGEFLGTHPLVEKISAEAEERGGTAITVVELRG
ncbi:MAG TPA: endonuclease MutS2 [Candidatus Acidoferrales bacterium]|nr:endonuclease MutS2 [Candidatus Acidoferrales bacterium]